MRYVMHLTATAEIDAENVGQAWAVVRKRIKLIGPTSGGSKRVHERDATFFRLKLSSLSVSMKGPTNGR